MQAMNSEPQPNQPNQPVMDAILNCPLPGCVWHQVVELATDRIMLADVHFRIVYMNSAALHFFQEHEDELRAVWPDFRATALIGRSIDGFHRRGTVVHEALRDPTLMPMHHEIQVGGCLFDQSVHMLQDHQGRFAGNMVIWRDITEQRRMARELNTSIHAASQGNLHMRLSTNLRDPVMQQSAQAVNVLLATLQQLLEDLSLAIHHALENPKPTQAYISSNYGGAFGDIVTSLNKLTTSRQRFTNDLADMMARFEAGAMAPVMAPERYSGIHFAIAQQINELISGYATMTQAILHVADAYSRGDLNMEPPQFPGERQSITVALCQIRNNLRLISEEIAALLHQLSLGELQVRAVPDRYQGTFRALLEDINHLLDATATPFLEARLMIESLARGEISHETASQRPGAYGQMDQAIDDISRRLQHLLYYDRLTELPNRFLLTEILHRAIAKAKRSSYHVALLLCDLDRFKPYNDLHGSQFGDALLRAAAVRITQHLRPNDTVSRFADDEFAILLEECTGPLQAQQLAQRLVQAMRLPFVIDGIEVRLSISIGIGMAPDDGLLTENIFSAAELALSEAKRQGGDQLAFHAGAITETLRTRITIEEALRRAIERDEEEQQLTLYFQPIWDGRTGTIVGAEALLRWHQGETIVSPGTFLPIAEQGGLMVALGQFVLHRAFAQLARWHEQGFDQLYLTINCHSEQFRDGLILQQLEHAAARCPVALDKVVLELTEESLVDQAATLDTLRALKARGIRLAVDDFGTGYSSLAYLSRLPVDVLKIDRTFIKDLPAHSHDTAIVRTIIELGSGLGLSIVAEGVETEAQRQFLLEQRCHLFQGFLMAPALSGDTFLTKLRAA